MTPTIRRIDRLARSRAPRLSILVAVAGVGICLAALAAFLAIVATNNLSWYPGFTVQEHYLEIGRSYSQGFVVGFFLCFFLVMISVSVRGWIENRRLVSRVGSQPRDS
jgi:hypothetical protein